MADLRRGLRRFAARVEEKVDEQRYRLGLGGSGTVRIEPYRGFGRGDRAWIKGRVLRGNPVPRARETDSVWLNLASSIQRFESDEVPGAKVRVRCPGFEQVLTADGEGYFEAWIGPAPPFSGPDPWHTVALELVEPAGGEPFRTGGLVLVPPPSATFGVISDVDDTVIRTDVASRLRMMKNVLLGNVHTRLPFPGVAAFYRALERGGGAYARNPVFYVSSSPWNLYDLLDDFLALRKIPSGPLLLRDWGLDGGDGPASGHGAHKTGHIRRILDLFPTLPFILVGDSGQEDPEIYHRAVHDHPGRIPAVYIRDVTRHPERIDSIRALAAEVERAGSTLVLCDDTLAAARHAASRGWIAADALDEVAAAAARDE